MEHLVAPSDLMPQRPSFVGKERGGGGLLPSALLAPPPGSPRETEARGSLREIVGWGREKGRQIAIFRYNTSHLCRGS